uniref:Putative leucine-rich repeat protein (LRRP) n=1 Tax=Trypanosoma congolense (strain IL3000) TaxID=1068625 RepID=G0UZW4_TRYCI|nr:putative leucine-rich repeat protein (LRRP) [Trypanosoma congolense IL3000]
MGIASSPSSADERVDEEDVGGEYQEDQEEAEVYDTPEDDEEQQVAAANKYELFTDAQGTNNVLLRNDVSEFTTEELNALAHMEFADDDYYSHVQMDRGVEGLHDGEDGTATAGTEGDNSCLGGVYGSDVGSGRLSSMHRMFGQRPMTDGKGKGLYTLREFLPASGRVGGVDAMADAVLQQQQLHAADCGLRDTLPIECFLNLTHLYMQHNEVESLEGLTLMARLRVLVVHHNAVVTLRPIAVLTTLNFLDARHNKIEEINPAEDLPCESLKYLALLDNPCSMNGGTAYREKVIRTCKNLTMLDDSPVGSSDKGEEESESDSEGSGEEESDYLGDSLLGDNAERTLNISGAVSASSQLRLCQSLKMSKVVPLSLSTISPKLPAVKGDLVTTSDEKMTDRLCEQLRHRSANIRQMAGRHAWGEALPYDDAWECDEVGAHNSFDRYPASGGKEVIRPSSSLSASLPTDLLQERATKARLYDDIQFALDTNDTRVQQLAEAVWDDVGKVLCTRQALVGHRRQRMEESQQQPSSAYAKCLEVLQEESREKNLDKYRKQDRTVTQRQATGI